MKDHPENIYQAKQSSLLVWFSFSVIFLILIWVLEIIFSNLKVNFRSIIEIHDSVSVFLIDLIPFVSTAVYYQFKKNRFRYLSGISKEKSIRTRLIKKYSEAAERLGREDYSVPIQPENENDTLGSSLKFLMGYLKASHRKEKDLNWVTEGKESVSRILRLYNKIDELSLNVLKNIISYTNFDQGAFYLFNDSSKTLTCVSTYAYNRKKYINQEFRLGEGLVGQCAYEKDFVYRTEIPDDYISISSGILGDQKPKSIILIPLISDGLVQGVVEFASVNEKIPKITIQLLLELGEIIARTIYNLKLNEKTEKLLNESRELTAELRKNEKILNENAELMQKTQAELQKSNIQLEAKVKETEIAQSRLHWLLEKASEVISIYDKNINLVYVSPSVKRILGYSEEEMKLGKDFERLTRQGNQKLRKLIEQSVDGSGVDNKIQYSFVSKEGETIYLESTAKNHLDDPAIQGIIINSIEITERIRAEREERLKTRMQSLSENSLDLILRLSTAGQFHYLNPVVEDYIGIPAGKMANKNLSEIEFSAHLKEYLQNTILDLKSKPQKTNTEISLPVRMGEKMSERIISFDAIPELTNNELETILFVGHDITEGKRIEKEIQLKNKNIQDSINYAEKIQKALLPEIEYIKQNLPQSFVFYRPKDVVSGDFPWFHVNQEELLIAAVDCTGHGVPGALLSFIAFFLLKDVALKTTGKSAGQICDLLHDDFRKTLKQDSRFSDTRDGLDIALCKIYKHKNKIEFAGAHRQLLFLSEGELTEYKGNRKAIGGMELLKKADEKFINHSINYKKGDKVFFFSDGLTDQLGGPYGRKYSPKRVKELIVNNPGNTMEQFHDLFNGDFNKWQKGFKQLDDVLMIGIEF